LIPWQRIEASLAVLGAEYRVKVLCVFQKLSAVRACHLCSNYFNSGASIAHAATTCAPLG
jgi:hypothetical protein